MNVDRGVFLFAGFVILLGLLLALTVSTWWLVLCALAGVNMIQASFTGFCPAAFLMKKIGLKPGSAFR